MHNTTCRLPHARGECRVSQYGGRWASVKDHNSLTQFLILPASRPKLMLVTTRDEVPRAAGVVLVVGLCCCIAGGVVSLVVLCCWWCFGGGGAVLLVVGLLLPKKLK